MRNVNLPLLPHPAPPLLPQVSGYARVDDVLGETFMSALGLDPHAALRDVAALAGFHAAFAAAAALLAWRRCRQPGPPPPLPAAAAAARGGGVAPGALVGKAAGGGEGGGGGGGGVGGQGTAAR